MLVIAGLAYDTLLVEHPEHPQDADLLSLQHMV